MFPSSFPVRKGQSPEDGVAEQKRGSRGKEARDDRHFTVLIWLVSKRI